MKVRAVQFSPALGDVQRNLAFHLEAGEKAAAAGVNLVVFPELSLSGYQLKDIVSQAALRPESPELHRLQELSRKLDLLIGVPLETEPGIIHNAALYFSGGRLLHRHLKVQLPNFGMFEEKMIFRPGETFQVFNQGERAIGLLVCREMLYPAYAYLYFLQHSDILLCISNSPCRGLNATGFSSLSLWENIGYVYSVFFHQHVLFVNRSGFEDGIGFGGGSFYAAPGRGIVRQAKYFEEDILDCELLPQDTRRARLAGNYLRDERPEIVLREMRRILNA